MAKITGTSASMILFINSHTLEFKSFVFQIISFIEKLEVIEKILRHLDLWDIRNHDSPQKVSDYILDLICDETNSRIPELESWY